MRVSGAPLQPEVVEELGSDSHGAVSRPVSDVVTGSSWTSSDGRGESGYAAGANEATASLTRLLPANVERRGAAYYRRLLHIRHC